MTIVRFDTIFQSTSGLPKDAVVNTWHFRTAAGVIGPTDYDNVRDMLKDFFTKAYTISGSATARVSSFMTNQATSGTVLVKGYILGETPGAPPDYSSTFGLAGVGSTAPIPSEVALCVSFQAALADGTNQRRRRNRKYIGPFSTAALGSVGRPATSLQNSLIAAGREMILASNASLTWDWVGYSPTDAQYWVIDNGWVDNAWDSQRRRGLSGSSRVVFADDAPPA